MHFILIIAMLFIIYEAYKLVFTQRQISVLGDLEQLSRTTNVMEKRVLLNKVAGSFLHKGTIIMEFFYIVFCVLLLLTKVWYVGLLVLLLMFLKGPIYKMGASKKSIWIVDCIISIILLAIIVMIYI